MHECDRIHLNHAWVSRCAQWLHASEFVVEGRATLQGVLALSGVRRTDDPGMPPGPCLQLSLFNPKAIVRTRQILMSQPPCQRMT